MVTFELPGLEKGQIFHLFFKGLGAIGANGDLRRRRNNFRGRLYGIHENISKLSKKSLFENAKMRPDFRAAQNDYV